MFRSNFKTNYSSYTSNKTMDVQKRYDGLRILVWIYKYKKLALSKLLNLTQI